MYFFLFFFGLVIGSFLNVVTLRYNPDSERGFFNFADLGGLRLVEGRLRPAEGGRSHCMSCNKTLGFFELIPVFSFIAQGGKCRGCKTKLSWQYPLVELATAAIFAGVPFFLKSFYEIKMTLAYWQIGLVVAWVLVFLVWLLITVIDFRHYIIPDGLNLTLLFLGIVITALLAIYSDGTVGIGKNSLPIFHESFVTHYLLIFSPFQNVILNHILGLVIGGAFFGLFRLLRGGRAMGWGDAKLAAASGLVLGWPDVGLAMTLAFIIGGIFGAILLFRKRKKMKDKLPFGPFFVLGAILTVFFGQWIIQGYFALFGL